MDFSSETQRKCMVALGKESGEARGRRGTAGGVELNFRLRNLLRYKEIFLQGVRPLPDTAVRNGRLSAIYDG